MDESQNMSQKDYMPYDSIKGQNQEKQTHWVWITSKKNKEMMNTNFKMVAVAGEERGR